MLTDCRQQWRKRKLCKNYRHRFNKKVKDARIIISGDFGNTPDDKALKLFYDEGMNNIWTDLDIDTQNESSVYTDYQINRLSDYQIDRLSDYQKKLGITDQILYSQISRSHTLKGGFIETKPMISKHKIVWALLGFPPPRVKKKNGIII